MEEFDFVFVRDVGEFADMTFSNEWLDRENQIKGMYGRDYRRKKKLVAISSPKRAITEKWIIENIDSLTEGIIDIIRIYNEKTRMFESRFGGFRKIKRQSPAVKSIQEQPDRNDTARRTKTGLRPIEP